MESKPLVSIIIPTYNSAKYLAEAIESALGQTYKNREIIVVDDGSTDNTREILSPYKDKIIYHYQENQERSVARNTGIKMSKGNYLQFLDADDLILPEKLELQVDFLENNLGYAVVYSDFRYFNGFDRTKLNQSGFKFYSGNIFKELVQGNFIPVHTPLIRKSCIDKAGLFQTKGVPNEDWDLWLRMAYAGYEFYYIDKVLALCRRHEDNTSLNSLRMVRARLEVIKSVDDYVRSKSTKEIMKIPQLVARQYQNLGGVLLEQSRYIEGLREMRKSWRLCPGLALRALTKGLMVSWLGKKFSEGLIRFFKKIG